MKTVLDTVKNWKDHFTKRLTVTKVTKKHNSNNEDKYICYDEIYIAQWFDILVDT